MSLLDLSTLSSRDWQTAWAPVPVLGSGCVAHQTLTTVPTASLKAPMKKELDQVLLLGKRHVLNQSPFSTFLFLPSLCSLGAEKHRGCLVSGPST